MDTAQIARMKTVVRNMPGIPDRLMARYLRRRGWVVFYLDSHVRQCNGGLCWLAEYEASTKQK